MHITLLLKRVEPIVTSQLKTLSWVGKDFEIFLKLTGGFVLMVKE